MTDPNNQDQPPSPSTSTSAHQKQEALAAFTATLHSVGTNLETPLRDRASLITANEAALERQEAELAAHTARLARENAAWAGLADETREGLKEIGDVQNWAEMIERDLLILEEMMGEVEGKNLEGEGEDGGEDGNGDEVVQNGVVLVNGNGSGSGSGNGNGHGKGKKVDGKGDQSKSWLRWW